MKTNKKEMMSWDEAWRVNRRAIKLLCKKCPRMMILSLSNVLLQAISPYVIIFFSAKIIEELAGGRSPKVLQGLVLITLGVTAALALIKGLLVRYSEAEEHTNWISVEQFFSEKMFSMDFADVDATGTHEMLSQIIVSARGGGWGLHGVLGNTKRMFSAVCTILGGLVLTAPLLTSRIPDTAGSLAILDQPVFLLGLLILMLVSVYAGSILATKPMQFIALHANDHNLGNLLFSFFAKLGNEKDRALDMRIYRQEQICKHYNENKEAMFGTKGIFARYFWRQGGLCQACSAMISVVFIGFVYVYVCLKAWAGAFGVGAVTQYVAAVSALAKGAANLMKELGGMRSNATFLRRAFEFLDIPNNMYQGSLSVEKRRDNQYEIEFRDVGFQYPGSDSWALRHVSVKFHVGERLAVVGENGSGKTTFIKLLCRLYDPTEGEILLNGIRIDKYKYNEYMNIFSVVFQDFKLFSFPVGENVASGSAYDREQVIDCLERAGFGDRLKALPQGLNTQLYKDFDPKGVDVSGGEAQKIALARALYKESPFIILDEPTAALDPIAEQEIYTRFNEIVGDHTAVYISHRLSSCRFCSRITVFEKGSIVQSGSHEELVADEKGKYYELWNAQAQYYVNE